MRSIKSCVGAPEQGALGCIQKLVWNVLWGCVLKAVDSVLQDSKVSFLGIHHLLNQKNHIPENDEPNVSRILNQYADSKLIESCRSLQIQHLG